ncbi:MAG TPA: TonB-dependent receptor [Allosphingosinicella sp.]|uniref:TonB-dependent receptor domain-containing protein n=1 Tax=Allosphingosinicella sp. TaxID=2823234 RepID=UPI002ED82403
MKLDFRHRLLATTLLVGASVLATPAAAQQTPPTDGTSTDVTNPTGPVEGAPIPSSSAEGEPVDQAQDIVVTGSRIPQPNLESVAPVTVVSSQDVKLSGTTRVEDLLNSLPSVVPSQSSGISNGSNGTASIDLRGLGSSRTLTLINGRRLLPGDPAPASGSAADINIIPASLLRRVEVLTGGASSTYGADAVAGVVNFIMDSNFTGVRLDAQYGFYQHNNTNPDVGGGLTMRDIIDARTNAGFSGFGYPKGSVADGGQVDATLSLGSTFDDGRGHAMAYIGYRNVDAVTQDRRDYSACVIQNTGTGAPQCGGSATSGEGNALLFLNGTSTFFTLGRGTLTQGLTRYNFAPTNYFQRPDERYTAGVFANYEVSEAVQPYLEFMFMDDRTIAQIAPSGNFGNTLTINCNNPLLSAQQRATICRNENLINGFIGNFPTAIGAGYNPTPNAPALNFVDPTTGTTYNRAFFQLLRRNVEGGPRRNDLQRTTFRNVLGLRGDLSNVWSYDAYYQFSRVNYNQTYSGEFSATRLGRALDVVDDPRTPGVVDPICRSVLDGSDPLCVPYDVFSGNGVSDEAIEYLSVTGLQKGNIDEKVANASFTGLLGEWGLRSPWAEDGIGVNVGVEYRKNSLDLETDQAFRTGDLTGQGAPTLPTSGDIQVSEFFAETQIPIVQKSFIDDLSFVAGYRKSYYETKGADGTGNDFDTDTYKVGIEFAPVQDIRFRGAYNRAVRAPNVQELFATNYVGLDGSTDPCAGRVITATDYGCLAQGMRVGQQTPANPAGQYQGLLGGNVDLEPEKATTKTLGVVLQPRFLPRFAFSVDYYDIEIRDAIRGYGADAILADCVDNATASFTPASCDLVVRDPAGSLWLSPAGYVIDTPINTGQFRTKGFEFNGSYSMRLGGLGNLSSSFVGTLLDSYSVNNGLTEPYDCAGYYGPTCSPGGVTDGGAPLPKWRHKLRTTLQMPNGLGLSVQWRHIGKVKAETTSGQSSLQPDPVFNYDPGVVLKAHNYIDLSATFTIGDSYNFRFGVNNVFDNDPPLVTSGNANRNGSNLCPSGPCNGNTYPGLYDAIGRYIFAGVTLDF